MGNVNGRDIDYTEEVNLAQFKLLRVVGRGAFGKVRIVERRDTQKLYALKYISKHECVKMDAVRNIFRERLMLEEVDHPFVCCLRFAWQDEDYMYMVMDLMQESTIRFWIAELSLAIRYLHRKHIVHRDVKPDNVLLDATGHVALTDFNVATRFVPRQFCGDAKPSAPMTSHSGTAAYMAPEVFGREGYDESVDWWSLGVLFYECVFGRRPFEATNTDELRAAISRGKVKFPTNPRVRVSPECISAIRGFLEPDPSKRFCSTPENWVAYTRHPFFASIDFDVLESKTVTPPFTPSSDKINFDATYDLEELLLEDEPLDSRRSARQSKNAAARRDRDRNKQDNKDPRRTHSTASRRRKHPSGITPAQLARYDRDMQLIEERFKTFDYSVFERYEGILDRTRMTVGEPPEWVKPANGGKELPPVSVVEDGAVAPAGESKTVENEGNRPRPSSILVHMERQSWSEGMDGDMRSLTVGR